MADPGFWRGGGGGRPRSGRSRAKPEGGPGACPPENFEHLESLKWHCILRKQNA